MAGAATPMAIWPTLPIDAAAAPATAARRTSDLPASPPWTPLSAPAEPEVKAFIARVSGSSVSPVVMDARSLALRARCSPAACESASCWMERW